MPRPSYHDVAQSVGQGGEQSPEPSRNPFACAANGCPILGSITIGSTRLCFVHQLCDSPAQWPIATARILNRMNLVEASRLLRKTVPPDRLDRYLDDVRQIARDVEFNEEVLTTHGRQFGMLLRVERVLIDECTSTEDLAAHHERVATARDAVRGLMHRYKTDPEAREPGQDDT